MDHLDPPRPTDPLTGLGDRRAFDAALAEAVGRVEPLSLVVIELDRLDEIRVSHGPQRSDRAMKEAAGALIAAIRSPVDECFRWRHNGFAVLLPRTGGYEAEEIGHRLADAVGMLCKRPDGTPLTATFGAAQLADEAPNAHVELVEAADAALRSR